MPHKDDSLFSILTVTMIIIIYLRNKADSEKMYLAVMGSFSLVLCGTSDLCYEKPSL